MFDIKNRQPTADEKRLIQDYKRMIFEGFTLALESHVPKNIAGLLVDEEYGADILREAKRKGLTFAMPVEKSGQEEFDFDYGVNYARHIEEFNPTFVKVLVRFNPAGDATMNQRQLRRLKELSDYLKQKKKPFLFELIVPPTPKQLAELGGSKEAYDQTLRPELMVESMKLIQNAGVEPVIWKLEGVEKPESAKAVVEQAQRNGQKSRSHNSWARGIERDGAKMAQGWSQNTGHNRVRCWKNYLLAATF